jgi:hypothetical protein
MSEHLPSETMITERINVVAETAPSILILDAMSRHIKDEDFVDKFGGDHGVVDVQMFINGQPVAIAETLSEAWQRLEAHFEERAKEKAMEMISGAGLKELLETIERAEWTIRQKLEAACPTR